MIRKFRKQPVVIEAVQFIEIGRRHPTHDSSIEHNGMELLEFMGVRKLNTHFDSQGAYLTIETLEGGHQVRVGDWIIKGIAGEFYPCKPDIFEKTYEVWYE